MKSRIKETFEAYCQATGNGERKNIFDPEYQPNAQHEQMRKEYYALTAYIVGQCWQQILSWHKNHPGEWVMNEGLLNEDEVKKAGLRHFQEGHWYYVQLPTEKLFSIPTERALSFHGPYKRAELKAMGACSTTSVWQTQQWVDTMKRSPQAFWQRWLTVVERRRALQPHSVNDPLRQIEVGFIHGWGLVFDTFRNVVDAFFRAHKHLPNNDTELYRIKNDSKNYLIHLATVTTPVELFFNDQSRRANHLDYNENDELCINLPSPSIETRASIYDVIKGTIGKPGIDKAFKDERLGCPAALNIPGNHSPAVVSQMIDIYFELYQKLLQHPNATQWYQEEITEK